MEMESEVSLFLLYFILLLYVVPVRIIVFTRSQMPLLMNKITVLVHITEINGKMTELNNSPQFFIFPDTTAKVQKQTPEFCSGEPANCATCTACRPIIFALK